MPKIAYKDINFGPDRLEMIRKANEIIDEYTAQGYDLTLRQLYYQFVSRDFIKNKQSEYKRLGDIVNDARLAGLIDWDHITDRTRNLRSLSHWSSPKGIIKSAADSFHIDMWKNQNHRVEVWIEKDALVGVIEGVCTELDLPHFSCRGYTSQSEMWAAAQRLRSYDRKGQTPVVLHLGDHDPSGIDMSRDIQDRIELFAQGRFRLEFKRLALNMDQVEEYEPPPNPAKTTDSRYAGYIELHGEESWELDALEPRVISDLIQENVDEYRDLEQWEVDVERETEMKEGLTAAAERWEEVTQFLDGNKGA